MRNSHRPVLAKGSEEVKKEVKVPNHLNAEESAPRRGLDNLVVDWTKVSYVDGSMGKLYYRGIDIAEIAAQATFEETAYLLLCGSLPLDRQLEALSWKLRHLAMPPDRVLRIIKELPRSSSPLHALQVALSALTCIDLGERLSQEESLFENALRVIAQTPVVVAAAYRHCQGAPMISPLVSLNHAENFLYMVTGEVPSKATSRFFEIALLVQMDHGFNPSTFTARAVASTLTNIYAAASAAVAALSGPLHGGASTHVLEMIDEFKRHPDLEQQVKNRILSGSRIMGMGHRIYRAIDPRALILEDVVQQLATKHGGKAIKADLQYMKSVENYASQEFKRLDKPLFTNVDFWTGTLYHHLGLDRSLYPAIFAVARITGWCAHILELRQANRLYRPLSEYRGSIDVPYVPLLNRRKSEA